jgi:hypothetical protein
VQVFLLGAKFRLFNLLLGLGLLQMMKKQMLPPQQFDWHRLRKAYQRPDKRQPELLWQLPTSEVQTILQIYQYKSDF